jgi:type III pantothenate kinase
MNLAIDIGNTRIKAAVFDGTMLLKNCIIENAPLKELQSFINNYPKINNAIICSVTDYPKGFLPFLKKKFKLVELSNKTPLPFRNTYKTHETLGKDRIAGVAGAQFLLPQKKILVINAGTCITYDFIDGKGAYYGGAISPGLNMRFSALHTFTSKLPLIKADSKFNKLTGVTTKESILTGVQMGLIEEVNGFINMYKKKYPGLHIILTGGSSHWLSTELKNKIILEPLLTLTGLNVILALCLKQKA